MSSPRKKASKKAVESDSEGRPSRTKRAPSRLDPSSDAGELSGSETPRRGGSRRMSVERKKKRGPGRPRKTESARSRSKSPAPKKRAAARKRRRSVDVEKEYEVEQFLDLQLLVKWKGYAKSSATWEPLKNLQTCDEMVVEYLEKVKQKLIAQMESKSSEEETKEKEEGAETPKRKRGRPAKKAKVTEKAKASEEEEVEDEKEADE